MIGIYKITNKINGKSYIGYSNNIERRFKEHCYKNEQTIDKAIRKYGADSFAFEVLEECSLSELQEKEKYWISVYNTYYGYGYNEHEGGVNSVGENNNNAKLTESDVYAIRQAYNNHCQRRIVYEQYAHKITFSGFSKVWDGTSWPHICPEVFTEENKKFYMKEASNGELSNRAILTDEEVIYARQRYVNETAAQIWEDYKDRIQFQTFQQILWGRTYKHLPIYKKKTKEWINI